MRNAILLLILPVMLSLSCGSELVEGILIGAGSGKALTESQRLAEQKKTALIAEILSLREQLDNTTDPSIVASLQDKLKSAEKKQEMAEWTDIIATQVQAGIVRDWGDKPASTDNLTWLLGSAATILGGYGAKKTYDVAKKDKQIAAVKIASKSPAEQELYKKFETA